MTDLRWEFSIIGDQWALTEFAFATQSREDWQIVNDEGWVLRLPLKKTDVVFRVDDMSTNPVEFYQRIEPVQEEKLKLAEEILGRISAAIQLLTPSAGKLKLSYTHYCEGRRKVGFLKINEIVEVSDRLSYTSTNQNTGESERHPANLFREILDYSDKFTEVEDALKLFHQYGTRDWVSLYKVYEHIRALCGSEEKLRKKLQLSKADISSFTGSANNPAISGDLSRHAVQIGEPPKKTMTLQQGREFIRTLMLRFLSHVVAAGPTNSQN
ncbi:MAG: hypothetical protein CVV27_02935 [Candidatus Melainabacteria bacterium HGW-Melainabacteria-1]|nr:MAG: hypothetical protein CVV27_02935 [Candidatus Melainabacteria bacterium HGW-Melainabacteria-1]